MGTISRRLACQLHSFMKEWSSVGLATYMNFKLFSFIEDITDTFIFYMQIKLGRDTFDW